MAPELQGQVSSFADVQAQPNYQNLPSETQAQIALEYFDKRVASQANFQKADPNTQETIRQEFRAKYKVPDIKPAHGAFTQGNQAAPVQMQELGQGLGNIGKALTGYVQSVPGQIGEAFKTEYKNSQTPTSQIEKYLSIGPSAIEGLRNLAQAPADLSAAAGNAYFGKQVFDPGYQLPSVNDIPVIGPKIKQIRDRYPVFSFVAENTLPVDVGLEGLGKLRGAHKAPVNLPKVRAPGATYGEFGRPVGFRSQGRVLTQGQKIGSDVEKFIQDAQNFKGIDPKATAQMRAKAYKQAFDSLQQRANATRVPALKAKIEQAQGKLQSQFEAQKPVKAQKQNIPQGTGNFNKLADFVQKLRKAGRSKEADAALGQFDRETRAKVYDEVKRRETAEKEARKQADQGARQRYEDAQTRVKNRQTLDKERIKQLVAEERASQKLQRELEAEGRKLQNKKDKQAIKDRLALERAESRNRNRELKQLKASIESSASEAAANEKAGKQLLGAVEQAVKKPAQKVGTANEYKAAGPDEYARMAKERANEQQAQAKQQNRQKPATQGPEKAQPKAKPAEQPKQKTEVAEASIKPGQALAQGLKTPTEIRAAIKRGEVKLTSKGMKTLDALEAAFENGQKVKMSDYVPDPTRKKGAPIQGDSLERSIDGLKISKNGNVTAMMHTDQGIIRSYSLDSINKIEVLDKPAVEGAYVKAGTLDKMQGVLDRLKSGEAVSAQEIKEAVRVTSETEFKQKTKDLSGDKINKLGKEVDC
jgi:hypothetical protein